MTEALPVLFDNIPADLKQIPRWVLWRNVEVGADDDKRVKKMPMQLNGKAASSSDPATWTNYQAVVQAFKGGGYSGIGFVFNDDDNLVGIDLDDCYDPATGFTNAASQQIAEGINGYMEVSPSGTGVKIFTRADFNTAHVDHTIGLECYARGRFFTVTGHHISGTVPSEPQNITGILPARTVHSTGDEFGDYKAPLADWDIHRVETELLPHLDPNMGYAEWLRVGAILHHQFNGDVEACELWDRWSAQGSSYTDSGEYSCEAKWKTFKGSGATLGSLIFLVGQARREEALANGDTILENSPMQQASVFMETNFQCEEGSKLVYYDNSFYLYRGTHYEPVEDQLIRTKMYAFMARCKKQGRGGAIIDFNPTPNTVSAAIDAVKALVFLENRTHTKPPIWLEAYRSSKPDASKLISLRNGIFHMEQQMLIPHSLGFFTENSLPFEFDINATCPTWEGFLQSVWDDDPESIDLLQEMFGYILSGDNKQQKFFNIIGPRRSGKGTINKVLVSLLGQENTVAPELQELTDTFGLQPWLGKLLASFTDARAPERNRSAVVSQLLRIVGNDTVTVNRKNKEAWSGYLPTRIVIYSNEALQLTENSNALTGRMLVLKMTKSFYNKEDVDLAHKLESELSGIFNWAMRGLQRRIARGGYFIQPESGREYHELMEEIGNPIGRFIEDALVFGEDFEVGKDEVFQCYKHWAHKKQLGQITEMSFKRRFIAAVQEHNVKTKRERFKMEDIDGSQSKHMYTGAALNARARAFIDAHTAEFDEGVF